jgi:very-short-patch-repair endonuclease
MFGERERISTMIEASRRELLDVGLRNPLVNYRPYRARGVEIVDELSAEVFRILVQERKTMRFKAAPDEEGVMREEPGLLVQPGDEQGDKPAARHVDVYLQTKHTSANLQSRLLKTEHDARMYVEEQGTNILYLALGMLEWFESESSQEVRSAPLVLVPVMLERSNARERVSLVYTEDDIGENLSLSTKLRLEFGVSIPQMPQENLDVNAYFDDVETLIQSQPRWFIDRNAVALSFFSFGKFLMYRDLDEEVWPDGTKPSEHAVIRALLGDDGLTTSVPQISEEEHLDSHLKPDEVNQVVNADSSQVLALLDVKSGNNLVIQGPPGTGKSQTIMNIIAEAIGHGKTVLFVSEKMAALEVVKRRLDEVRLGDACLELHSHKTSKKQVLDELGRTLRLGTPRLEQAEDDLRVLTSMRDRLNDYSNAVHTVVGDSGYTPYQAMGELVRQGAEGAASPRLDYEAMRQWTGSDFRLRQKLVEELQAQLAHMGVPSENLFYGSDRTEFLATEHSRLQDTLLSAKEVTTRLRTSGAELSSKLGSAPPKTRLETETLCRAARRAVQAPDLEGVRLLAEEWRTRREDIESLVAAGEKVSELRGRYANILIPEAWEQDLLETREHLAIYGRRWLRSLSGKYRAARDKLAALSQQSLPKDLEHQLAIVDAVLEARRWRETFSRHRGLGEKLYGARWRGEDSDWQVLSQITAYLIDLHEEIEERRLPEAVLDYLSGGPMSGGLEQNLLDVEVALESQTSVLRKVVEELGFAEPDEGGGLFAEQPFEMQESTLDYWSRHLDELQSMVTYNRLAQTCRREGLEEVHQLAETWQEAPSKLVAAFRYTWFEGLLERAFRERPALAHFNRSSHEYVAQEFRKLDRLMLEHNRARLACAHRQAMPNHEAGGQLGLLRHEIEKKSRHLPIRQLMRRAGIAIQAIKPVFMMSPISIANFLEPGVLLFDLVVFDEASQVPPVEAFGAIARGRQVVVVGDSKQMPPTRFFDSLIKDEEVDEDSGTAGLESILDLFAARAPERMLRWHYRSRHESLITVSNHEFYQDRLVIFPSPDKSRENLGLVYHHLPQTVYDRGRTHTNLGEARAVAEAVMEHARNRPRLTLGVASFSVAQMQTILDQLEILRRNDPSCESFFADHPHEPFFVKNLENVQGDERDVIFISIGYGLAVGGYLTMHFGPLNNEGGERRLNVLITRARCSCHVFTNLTADAIDLDRSDAHGVRALKTFLQYAQTGRLDVPDPNGNGRGPDSPFEESVLSALQREGYKVHTQVGSAGFYIDLAIVDPDKPGRYLLGIECDGATYHSARSARDRDRLRQEVLEDLGWHIHRIWSTDWFRDPQKELKLAVEAIEEAKLYSGRVEDPTWKKPPEAPDFESYEEPTWPAVLSIPSYKVAKPGVYTGMELHQVPPAMLADSVASVVEVESPVHIKEVSRRITEAASVARTGSRIKAAIEAACQTAASKGRVRRSGEFLWHPEMHQVPLRDRSNLPDASKKLELVAPEEIGAAVEKVVRDSFGIERTELPGAVLRLLFGFRQARKASQQQVEMIVEDMIAKGELFQRRGQLVTND